MEAAQPICIAFSNADVSKSEVLISSNAIGVTGGNEGIITIPRFAGDWGVYRIVFFDKGLSVNAIVWFWVNSKRIRQFKIRGVYDNSTKTMTFSISQLKELHGLVLFKTVLSNGGRHLRLSLTSWNETVISQHTQNMITEPAATGNMESGSYKLEYRNNNFPTDMSGNCIIFLISDEG